MFRSLNCVNSAGFCNPLIKSGLISGSTDHDSYPAGRFQDETEKRRQIRNLGDRSKRNICLKIKFTAFPLPPPPRAFSSNFSKSMMKNNIRRKNYLHPWCFITKLVFAQEKSIYLSLHSNIFFFFGGGGGGRGCLGASITPGGNPGRDGPACSKCSKFCDAVPNSI